MAHKTIKEMITLKHERKNRWKLLCKQDGIYIYREDDISTIYAGLNLPQSSRYLTSVV